MKDMIKFTAKAKTDALVEWCKRKICDDAKSHWKVHFTNHYANFTLVLEFIRYDSIGPVITTSEGFARSGTTKHNALSKIVSLLKTYYDMPDSFEEMAIANAVGA